MTPVLVDSNILIDIATDDPAWGAWSADALARSGQDARLIINPLIYAEVSVTHSRIETLDALLPEEVFAREPLPWAAGFLAARPSWPTAAAVASVPRLCRTSTSAPTPQCAAIGC